MVVFGDLKKFEVISVSSIISVSPIPSVPGSEKVGLFHTDQIMNDCCGGGEVN